MINRFIHDVTSTFLSEVALCDIILNPLMYIYCIGRRQYQRYSNMLFWGCLSGAVGSVDVLCSSNLARDEIFTASIGSVDSLYLSVYIY